MVAGFVKEGEDEYRKAYQKFVVPDGKWVVKVSTGSTGYEESDEHGELFDRSEERWIYNVLGQAPEHRHLIRTFGQPTRDSLGARSWHRRTLWLLVGDQPFGVIQTTECSGLAFYSSFEDGPTFTAARQLHKGELGRFPEFAQPKYAREGREPATWKNEDLPSEVKPYRVRELRRHHARWAQLTEVAALVRMAPEELVRRYFAFADAKGRGLPVLFADRREEIHGQIINPFEAVKRFEERELPQLFDRDQRTIWMRQGFAKTVLGLHYFGHVPELK